MAEQLDIISHPTNLVLPEGFGVLPKSFPDSSQSPVNNSSDPSQFSNQSETVPTPKNPSIDFKILGTMDFLPKVVIPGLNEYMYGAGEFLWHDIYLIKTTYEKMKQVLGDPENKFMIVDNLDSEGEWFVVKDTNPIYPILPDGRCVFTTFIFAGFVPAVASHAETTAPKSGKYYHILEGEKRHDVVKKLEKLRTFASDAYLCVGIYPQLLVCDYMYHI